MDNARTIELDPGTLLLVEGGRSTSVRAEPRRNGSEDFLCDLKPDTTVVYLGEHQFVEFTQETAGEVDGILWLKVLTPHGVGWCRAHRLVCVD